MNSMFYNCESLRELKIKKKFEEDFKKEIKNNIIIQNIINFINLNLLSLKMLLILIIYFFI